MKEVIAGKWETMDRGSGGHEVASWSREFSVFGGRRVEMPDTIPHLPGIRQ